MAISNTLQRVGFTSELYLLYDALQSVDLQVKNTCKGGIAMFRYILTTCALFACHLIYCQSITIKYDAPEQIVGTPFTPPYEYSYGQVIYLQNDMQSSGNINALTFFYSGLTFNHSDSFTIYMGVTDMDCFTSDSTAAIKSTDLKRVYNGTLTGYTVPGAVTISLDSIFHYNGDSNLVIAINETKAGGDDNYFLGYGISYANKYRGIAWANISPWNLATFDLTPGQFPTSGGAIPKVTLHGLTPLPCQSPKRVRFSKILHNAATVTWSPPPSGNAPTGYDVYVSTSHYKPIAITTPNPGNVADTQTIISSLNASTRYYTWVRSRSATCNSVWTVVDSFETLCSPAIAPTQPEPFNNSNVNGNFMPPCWQLAYGQLSINSQLTIRQIPYLGLSAWKGRPYQHQPGSDSGAVAFIKGDTLRDFLISPSYQLGTAGNKALEFDAAFTKFSTTVQQGYFDADDKFIIVVSTDEGLTWNSANTVRTWASPQVIPAAGIHYILPLTGYTGIVRIGFYVQSTSGNPAGGNIPTLFIDNVKISELLPVKLLEFKGTKEGVSNLLQWRTATEQNNRGFELQRSVNSSEFSIIGFVPTKAVNGNSTAELSYQYTDKKPFSAGSYYRLKQVDFDGKLTYSNIVFIKGEPATELVLTSLFPNPTNQLLNVVLETPKAQKVQMVIADLAGKTMRQQTLQLVKGTNNKTMKVATLAKGTYIVKVICADGCERAVRKFVKE